MNKQRLREKYTTLRQNLSAEQILDKSIAIANHLLKMDIWKHTYYHIFLSIQKQNEVDTEPIVSLLFGKNKDIITSTADFKTLQMKHFLLTEHTRLKVNSYGIPEPLEAIEVPNEKINVVFIPLLAYDLQGNRVGYGKGFYDRFLQKTKALKIGLSFFEPEKKITDTNSSDVKLDYCVSTTRIYKF